MGGYILSGIEGAVMEHWSIVMELHGHMDCNKLFRHAALLRVSNIDRMREGE